MFHPNKLPIFLSLFLLCSGVLTIPVQAAGTDSDQAYCFSLSDFSGSENGLLGICVTGLPDKNQGNILLGNRVIRTGDVLTSGQLQQLIFSPVLSQEDDQAVITYLPLFSAGLAQEAETAISIYGKRDDPPVAEDSSLETYKNLPNEGLLKASDPEGQALTFTLVKSPKRGDVVIREDGSFLYTPKNNKVGSDSFTYTVSDPAGNLSREATVAIKILKPTDSAQYTDTAGLDCRFEAEWLKNTGIFSGESISGQSCFSPDESISRGQFLAMLMQTLDLPVEHSVSSTGFSDDAPQWLMPYLSAAYRAGIITGYPCDGGVEFRPDQTITSDEAMSMIRSALNHALPSAEGAQEALAVWAEDALQDVVNLTRADAARILYQVSKTEDTALTSLLGIS